MNRKEAQHLSNYLKGELTSIVHELQFLLDRIEEAEAKYKINKQKAKARNGEGSMVEKYVITKKGKEMVKKLR